MDERIKLLAAYLGIPNEDVTVCAYEDYLDAGGLGHWLVVHEEAAYRILEEYIRDNLWSFRAEWLEPWVGLPADSIRKLQKDLSEDCNDVFLRLVGDEPTFWNLVDEAVDADGRGHFLSHYDGNEVKLCDDDTALYMAYRVS